MPYFAEALRSRRGAPKSPPTRPYCISGNRLIIKDLLWFSPLHSPHYIPLFEMDSTGPFGTLADVSVRSSRYPALRQPDKHCRTASRFGPGALRAQGTSTGAGRRQRQRPVGPAACPYRDDRTVTGGRNCQAVMAWIRTRLEVFAITGDPSILLAATPPDGGWIPRLGQTVTLDRPRGTHGKRVSPFRPAREARSLPRSGPGSGTVRPPSQIPPPAVVAVAWSGGWRGRPGGADRYPPRRRVNIEGLIGSGRG